MKKLTVSQIRAIEIFSWYGVIAILTAYSTVSFGILQPTHWIPLFLNITGSFAMLLDAWKDRNWQPVAINIVWILIAVVTMVK